MPLFIRQRFNRPPVLAEQWFPGQELAGIAGEWPGHPGGGSLLPSPPYAYLITPKGRFTIFTGDWIITESDGLQHVCPNALFEHTYAAVEAALQAPPSVPQGHSIAAS
jgi:hypothetical protein